MEQNPYGEATSSSASQDISRILWKPKIYNSVHKFRRFSLFRDLVIPNMQSLLLKAYFNIILPP